MEISELKKRKRDTRWKVRNADQETGPWGPRE